MAELGSLSWAWPILARAPRGDGHPVLVLPGLGAGDLSTAALRRFLRHLGYRTYGWRLGTNLGPTDKAVEGMPARLERICHSNGQPVSILGWSLGGIFARRLARQTPDSVRQVITLGSPIRLKNLRHSHARIFYEMLSHKHVEEISPPLEDGLGPLPVPATSIYSRLDGIVAWRACLDEASTFAENIEVRAAHHGFGYHPAVLYVVADRLAQAPGEWSPFRRPDRLRLAFPSRLTRPN
jgi:pimeloyl-ACP methyl ester carboxylesterase